MCQGLMFDCVGVPEANRDNYEYQDSRKTAFSRWLADATAQTTHTDLVQTKVMARLHGRGAGFAAHFVLFSISVLLFQYCQCGSLIHNKNNNKTSVMHKFYRN